MRAASPALTALISSGLQEWVKADLYTFASYDGMVLGRFTDADVDLKVCEGRERALSFAAASDQRMVRTGFPNNGAGADITVEAWIKPSSIQYGAVISKGQSGTSFGYGLVFDGSGHLRGRNSSNDYDLGGAMIAGEAYHVAVVYSASGMIGYINGAQSGTSAQTTSSDTTNEISVGCRGVTTPTEENFDGVIDGGRVYTRALSPAEIAEHYSGEFEDETGLIVLWDFNEGQGASAVDGSGNGNTGTLVNGPAWVSALGGKTFLSTGPILRRDMVETNLGVEVAEMAISVFDDGSRTLGGLPWLKALRDGVLDGGRVTLDRFLSDSWSNVSVGSVKWFSGRVAGVEVGRSGATIHVRSDVELLNISMPRNLYQPECRWTLFDSGCTLSRSLFTFNDTVASGSTRSKINCALSKAAGYFDLGKIHFSSGPNVGEWRLVKSYVPGVLTLTPPLHNDPTVGNAFDVSPGCDKRLATCGEILPRNPVFSVTGDGPGWSAIFSVDSGTDVFTALNFALNPTAHLLVDDSAVRVRSSGTLPAPLTAAEVYFVRDVTTNTFKLAATLGGAAINITSGGSGTHSLTTAGKFGNVMNFGGHPFIPLPDMAFQ